jgi:hypothetical protein
MDKATLDERLAQLDKKTMKAKPAQRGESLAVLGILARNAGEDFRVIHGGFRLGGMDKDLEPGDIIPNKVICEIPDDRLVMMLQSRAFIPGSQYTRNQGYAAMRNFTENILPTPRQKVNQSRQAVQSALAALAAAEAEVVTRKNELTTARSVLARHERELQDILDSDAIREAFTD